MRIAILDDYFNSLGSLPSFKKLDDHQVTVWTDHTRDEDVLVDRLRDTEALVLFRERTPITATLLARLPNLKLISQRSVYPHIDIEACTKYGVVVSSFMHPKTACYAAAELTWGLILSSFRTIPQQMASLRSGNWQMGVGTTLRGKTLGIYGYGRIARVVAGYGKAFGMRVLVYASKASAEAAAADFYHISGNRQTFFETCDVISLHVRLVPATRNSITFEDLSCMRSSALLVNTSRAGLIEPGALLRALDGGHPGFAAVDVYEEEPLTNIDHPLLQRQNVICTPHIGYVTMEEYEIQFSDVFDQILAFVNGSPIHVVNPQVLG